MRPRVLPLHRRIEIRHAPEGVMLDRDGASVVHHRCSDRRRQAVETIPVGASRQELCGRLDRDRLQDSPS